ncbi:histidine phosphatase family protein [Flavobacterium sp. MFBS3-15]|uniref:SixA phosphatase family protein n=1 Tax=Flavobacterium sp. MFBS3-15 TaxID=2989816 RepID=UPI002235D75D|nr:phosphoglycerate mutase family protein [Flavobacterium sp. MFBS3-15]MCW4470770.1 histidine phosphatase family protein [Flavobacterium sp. MFBS3-15]
MKLFHLIATLFFMTIASAQERSTTIYLIRHAEKADMSANTHLSEAGKKRAQKWAQYFAGKGISAVYATPYNRTRETAQPLADVQKLQVTEYGPREMDLITLAKQHHNQSVVVVGHSNTIPGYVNKALGENKHADIAEEEFGKVYIVQIANEKVESVRVFMIMNYGL